ncbi:hypothetical protein HYY69_00395 [Candidatus Woesearchaeota archaeon]|nr:hypothetical protein [Candidatus Woesearchaeota archaeon]
MKFIIEHLDGRLYNWSLLEYTHCSKTVGKENIMFTNIKGSSAAEKLKPLGSVENKSVIALNLKKVCILDPLAEKTLSPDDKNKFDYFIFGGILGNYPADKRTKTKLSEHLICEKRNIGNVQMSTNTAVYVSWKILSGMKFEEFNFIDELVIPMDDGEEVILPFRYVIEHGELVLAENFVAFLKNRKGF